MPLVLVRPYDQRKMNPETACGHDVWMYTEDMPEPFRSIHEKRHIAFRASLYPRTQEDSSIDERFEAARADALRLANELKLMVYDQSYSSHIRSFYIEQILPVFDELNAAEAARHEHYANRNKQRREMAEAAMRAASFGEKDENFIV